MNIPDYKQFTAAVTERTDQPDAAFDALRELAEATIGAKLFTVMTFDPATRMAQRIYSNMPDAYPVSGTKPANPTEWSRLVLEERKTFVANDIDGIAKVFSDHELIRSLGCESVINVPIIVAGDVIGSINCLHEAGFYTPEKVEAAEALKLPGALCMLLELRNSSKGDR
jgi:GAF domain-containing protein